MHCHLSTSVNLFLNVLLFVFSHFLLQEIKPDSKDEHINLKVQSQVRYFYAT